MASFVLSDDRLTQTNIAILTNCMRFQIPTYNVHLKVDMHLHNKDEYGSDRDDAPVRAHGRFIADTTLLSIVKDHSPRFPHKTVDELKLTKDVLDEACTRPESTQKMMAAKPRWPMSIVLRSRLVTRVYALLGYAQAITDQVSKFIVSSLLISDMFDCTRHHRGIGIATRDRTVALIATAPHHMQKALREQVKAGVIITWKMSTASSLLVTLFETADGVPNEAFEALIDLLTSDGIDDAPPGTSTVPRARVAGDGAALRDESGRLDFEKICSMFEGKDHMGSQGGIPVGAGEQDRRVADSLGGGAPTVVVNRRDIRVEDTSTLKANPVTSTVQDLRPDRSEYPDVDSANDALGCTRDEMRTLRRQYDELQRLIAERLGKGKELKGSERKTTQKVMQDGDDGIAVEVARLSEEETKRALTTRGSILVIASMTNARLSFLLADDPDSAPFKCTRGNLNPRDIRRALDFVERVDEIIWQRPPLPTNSSLDPMFSAGDRC
ncbi:hypothetical protein EDD15DRAFT_2365996 [Pisolithus albus]|nr:hypothetical protein EDD15DRAFT_2365996 [Pisolithus albus]